MEQGINNLRSLTGNLALDTLASGLITLAVCAAAARILLSLTQRALGRAARLDQPIRNLIYKAVRVTLWLLTVMIVAGAFGINASSLVALFSVVGLALSLSVQNVMQNLFSGVTLLVSKPFREGDFVEFGDKIGTVRSIGFFYTVLNTPDNISISVPNADLTAAAVKNYSREPQRRVSAVFSASYDAPTEAVRAAILEAVAMDTRILSEPAPFVRLSSYGSSSIEYAVRVWCANADYWDVYFELNENVRACFEKHGVEMSYEHINVHMLAPKAESGSVS